MFRAHYLPDDQLLPQWTNNPLIAALPRLSSNDDIIQTVGNVPEFDHAQAIKLNPLLREADINRIKRLYVPSEQCAALGKRIDQLIRSGYEVRDVFSPKYIKTLYSDKSCLQLQDATGSSSTSALYVEGLSGIGKSRAIELLLRRYPQTIEHHLFKGQVVAETQLVWISVDAPIGGSAAGLGTRLLAAYDEALGYTGTPSSLLAQHGGKSVDSMLAAFATAARSVHLGLLHIDDLQRLLEAPKKMTMIAYLVSLVNIIRCPLLVSATPDAWRLLRDASTSIGQSQNGTVIGTTGRNGRGARARKPKPEEQATFEVLRRLLSNGKIKLPRPQSANDGHFQFLVRAHLRLQWTEKRLEFSGEVCQALYYECVGITALLPIIHSEAQRMALERGGVEAASLKDYRTASLTLLKDLQPALDFLRENSHAASNESENAASEQKYQSAVPDEIKQKGLLA